jgi:glyoxylase-like metal-dependent hydrolase (beta-lactamase superfamily II)
MTLDGTNTYLVGAEPTIVIDPGPADRGHIDAVKDAAEGRGGIGAVLLTHSHGDHADGVELLGVTPTPLADGEMAAGLLAVATPGHAADHFCLVHGGAEGRVCFTGDLVLGEGSTFVPPAAHGGSLIDYLASLHRLQEMDLVRLWPGHGPAIEDPDAKIAEYIEHRLERERRLVAALEEGKRSRAVLQAEVWDDVPPELGAVAAIVMQAHLEKLEAEGRLPPDIKD